MASPLGGGVQPGPHSVSPLVQPQTPFSYPSSSTPFSTPLPSSTTYSQGYLPSLGPVGRAVLGPEAQLSGRHDGLYLYLARLLRPMWKEGLVMKVPSSGHGEQEKVCLLN